MASETSKPIAVLFEPLSEAMKQFIAEVGVENVFEIMSTEDPTEASQIIMQCAPCAFFGSISTTDEMMIMMMIFQDCIDLAKEGKIKSLITSSLKSRNVAGELETLFIQGVVNEPVSTKTLTFKYNLLSKFFLTNQKKMDNAKEQVVGSLLKEEKADNKARKVGLLKIEELGVGNDVFVFGDSKVKNSENGLEFSLDGPSPSTHEWRNCGVNEEDGVPRWRLVPKKNNANQDSENPTEENVDGWVYEGDKPKFNEETGKWDFSGEKPVLSLYEDGEVKANKVQWRQGELQVAKDSQKAVTFLALQKNKELQEKRQIGENEENARESNLSEQKINEQEATEEKNRGAAIADEEEETSVEFRNHLKETAEEAKSKRAISIADEDEEHRAAVNSFLNKEDSKLDEELAALMNSEQEEVDKQEPDQAPLAQNEPGKPDNAKAKTALADETEQTNAVFNGLMQPDDIEKSQANQAALIDNNKEQRQNNLSDLQKNEATQTQIKTKKAIPDEEEEGFPQFNDKQNIASKKQGPLKPKTVADLEDERPVRWKDNQEDGGADVSHSKTDRANEANDTEVARESKIAKKTKGRNHRKKGAKRFEDEAELREKDKRKRNEDEELDLGAVTKPIADIEEENNGDFTTDLSEAEKLGTFSKSTINPDAVAVGRGFSDNYQEEAGAEAKRKQADIDDNREAVAEYEQDFYYRTLEELNKENAAWYLTEKNYVYLEAEFSYNGIARVEDTLPLWIYGGGKKPEFLEKTHRWRFEVENAYFVDEVADMPFDVLDYLRNLSFAEKDLIEEGTDKVGRQKDNLTSLDEFKKKQAEFSESGKTVKPDVDFDSQELADLLSEEEFAAERSDTVHQTEEDDETRVEYFTKKLQEKPQDSVIKKQPKLDQTENKVNLKERIYLNEDELLAQKNQAESEINDLSDEKKDEDDRSWMAELEDNKGSPLREFFSDEASYSKDIAKSSIFSEIDKEAMAASLEVARKNRKDAPVPTSKREMPRNPTSKQRKQELARVDLEMQLLCSDFLINKESLDSFLRSAASSLQHYVSFASFTFLDPIDNKSGCVMFTTGNRFSLNSVQEVSVFDEVFAIVDTERSSFFSKINFCLLGVNVPRSVDLEKFDKERIAKVCEYVQQVFASFRQRGVA